MFIVNIYLGILKKGLLRKIDIPTDRLKLRTRQTRRGGGGPMFVREFSKIDSHRNSFFPSSPSLIELSSVLLKNGIFLTYFRLDFI